MSFELFFAKKYLFPRKRALSTTLISLTSIFVISLVVWLVVVFLSVTSGIEKNWIDKLVSINSPVRITPTSEYYSSYYYQIDSFSSSSNYAYKNIASKAIAPSSNPYSPEIDIELPSSVPSAKRASNGSFIDPVKEAFQILKSIDGVRFSDYEIAGAMLKLKISQDGFIAKPTYLTQMNYLTSYCKEFDKLMVPLSDEERELLKTKNDFDAYPVYLPKSMQRSGTKILDTGTLSYHTQTAASAQEQLLPIYVAGFYDPGILPVGNRCLLVDPEVTSMINASSTTLLFDSEPTNGINVWFDNLSKTKQIKNILEKAFQEKNITPYWKITTYKDYPFAQDLMQQFQSDKTIFTLIALIILIVACSNIISLLILLVNDKKKEIATIQAMGASPKSIALIFGGCGFIMGLVSCFVGVFAAIFTLRHLQALVGFLSFIQGHSAFNAAFFGDKLPNMLSIEALFFVTIATPIIALLAGLIPALKASKMRPSSILRSE